MDGQTRYAELGCGIAIGAQSACERSPEFLKAIHIWTPNEDCRCSFPRGVQHKRIQIHNMVDDHPKTLGLPLIESVWEFAKDHPGLSYYPPLLIHCAAGMHRSPTIAVVALMARGLKMGDACRQVINACCDQYDKEPVFPWFTPQCMEEIRAWNTSRSQTK